MKELRTPIVCVLGHVDHGKTTLLDRVRRTRVAEKEVGAITQHIGATEVPISVINDLCSSIMKKSFVIPGLLFIDTPGHHAFTTLRRRGGSLADLAVLTVDVMEGFKPQTYESIRILRRFKTPFAIAANKIDRIRGWSSYEGKPFLSTYERQTERVKRELDQRVYQLVERLYDEGFSSDRHDRVHDFQRNVAIVPVSAETGEGIPDLLMILVGLSQRFLTSSLEVHTSGGGVGSILDVREERGLGTTIDVILYDGEIKIGDEIVVGARDEPVTTKVRMLLKPPPMSDLRMERRFKRVKSVRAASGIKIAASGIESALAGSPVRVVDSTKPDRVIEEVRAEQEPMIELQCEGIIIKADSIGSLEALANELMEEAVPVQKADVGDISRKDVIEASTIKDPLLSIILGFDVNVLPDAKDEAETEKLDIIAGDVIYKLMEDYLEWRKEKKEEIERKKLESITMPAKIRILPDYVFRISKPAIVGVEVLGGRIKPGTPLIREDGKRIGVIRGIQKRGESIGAARYRNEVAVSIEGAIIGRQINEKDVLYADVPEIHVKILLQLRNILSDDELETLEMFLQLKRRGDPFWGK